MDTVQAVERLRHEYCDRRARNTSYSLRAFARDLHVPVSSLAGLMSGERKLTPRMARILADGLTLKPRERAAFAAAGAGRAVRQKRAARPAVELRDEVFATIKDWYHYAILSLARLDGFRSDPAWIAARLGITRIEADTAIDRLLRLGMLARDPASGRLTRVADELRTSWDVPSDALRHAHRQGLEQAVAALFQLPVDQRIVSSVTIAGDPRKLAAAKDMIRDFGRRLSELLESGERTEVLRLGIQLIPVTKPEKPTRNEERS